MSLNSSYKGVLISSYTELLPDVVGRNRYCLWKEGSVHVPNCKYFLVTEAERKHVRATRAISTAWRPELVSNPPPPTARQEPEGNSRHSGRHTGGTCTILYEKCFRQTL